MEENPFDDTIFETRESVMISPSGSNHVSRRAHFLKPSSNNAHYLKLPFLPHCSESEWPIQVSYNGWHKDSLPKWPTWVFHMLSKYGPIWKKSGIYEAILASTCHIRRNSEVIFAVAERWCCDTSSFIFPWGEATISLEDMMVLGGFSVLGYHASMPLESKELRGVEKKLEKVGKYLVSKATVQMSGHYEWLRHFMGSGDELEHEAFLSLWLSRFVFPGNVFDSINRENFSIAIYLARGVRIALAPTVLATLYRDVSLLKEAILASANLKANESTENVIAVSLWSPMQFVLVWAWERIPPLGPKPRAIQPREPRMARWHNVNRLKRENLRMVIDSCVDNFLWRPYGRRLENWSFPGFYKEKEQWVNVSSGCELSEEYESFARCLRVCHLVGVDSIELYLPHRVAMQFGFDQDLPRWIPRVNVGQEDAWENYSRSIKDEKLYFAPCCFEGDVTVRYLEWWEKSVLVLDPLEEIKDVKGKRSSRKRENSDVTPISLPAKRNRPRFRERRGVTNKPLTDVKVHSPPSLVRERKGVTNEPWTDVKVHSLPSLVHGNGVDCHPGLPVRSNWWKELDLNSNKGQSQVSVADNEEPLLSAKRHSPSSSTESSDIDLPPDFSPPKCDWLEEMVEATKKRTVQDQVSDSKYPFLAVKKHGQPSLTECSNSDVPPGFAPKQNSRKEMGQTCNRHRIQERVAENEGHEASSTNSIQNQVRINRNREGGSSLTTQYLDFEERLDQARRTAAAKVNAAISECRSIKQEPQSSF